MLFWEVTEMDLHEDGEKLLCPVIIHDHLLHLNILYAHSLLPPGFAAQLIEQQ